MDTETISQNLRDFLSANPWVFLLLIWIIIWKGLALWQSAQKGQKIWFIAIMIVNTMGLLEIAYLAYYYFKNKQEKNLPTTEDN